MAIVFVSPKRGQSMMVRLAFLVLIIVLFAISAIFLLPQIKDQITIVPDKTAYTAPDIHIDFELMDSEKVKKLDSFSALENIKEPSVGRTDPFTSY